ncbi:MAG: T9SS type A sorting domain-containing protein, partial [Bacteroidota bacterium]|nr:T9SS type A sorting domain-containing protein [Bacteroidota bacterium]MDX5429293.1 T9SS type A sorting domain-containing protein [Bacteroidota bacterium]MDX5506910.1 T9SS type A sorting domain-containing protein [Bacteroidota bacterium]
GTGTVIQGSSPIQLNGLSPGTAYDVVIWDTCASGYSDTSAVHSFTTASGPLPTASFTYSSAYTQTTQTVTFDASGSTNATGYYWDFGGGNLDTGVVVNNIYTGPGGQRTVTLTLENACGQTDTTFTINIYVDIEENLLSRTLNVYPNPTSGEVNIEFSIEGVQDVQTRIVNVLGQEVSKTHHGSLSGTFRYRYDLSDQPSGIYLLEVTSDRGKVTRRITMER